MIYSADACRAVGSEIAYKNSNQKLSDRQFTAYYGRTPDEVRELWELCSPHVHAPKLKHLFWALMYMKLYVPGDVLIVMLNTTWPTLQKWVWVWIEAIAMRHHDIIDWNKRNRKIPPDVWCRITVDGRDFQIGEPTPFNRKWKSPKQKGASVKYEIGISIYSGDIVWVYGPHIGSKHDYTIFKEKLMAKLDKGEMVEADAGYGSRGVAMDGIVRSRDDYQNEAEKREKSEMRARHETCNRRFKSWSILKQQFRANRKKHQLVFYAIVVMVQMSIDRGEVLFAVEPMAAKKQESYRI